VARGEGREGGGGGGGDGERHGRRHLARRAREEQCRRVEGEIGRVPRRVPWIDKDRGQPAMGCPRDSCILPHIPK
jgi:hypothetical protein